MPTHRTQLLQAELAITPGRRRRLWQGAGCVPPVLLSLTLWWPVMQGQIALHTVTVVAQVFLFGLTWVHWRQLSWPATIKPQIKFSRRRWHWCARDYRQAATPAWETNPAAWQPACAGKPVLMPQAIGLPWRPGRRLWVFADECSAAEWRRLNVWARFSGDAPRRHPRQTRGLPR